MTHEELLKEFSAHWKENDSEVETLIKIAINRNIEEARGYVKRIYGENIPNNTQILEDYYNSFEKSDATTVSLSSFYLLRTIKEFIANPDTLFNTYKKLKDSKTFWENDPNHFFVYDSNKSNNREEFAYDILHNFTDYDEKSFSKDRLLNLTPQDKAKLISYLKTKLSEHYKSISKELVLKYIHGIINSLKILQRLGVLKSQIEKNNRDRKLMGLESLKFDFEKDEKSGKYSVEQLMDEKFLSTLPMEKLVSLHAVYSNRVKKITQNLGIGLFICNKFDMFNSKKKSISDESLLNAYYQYNALDGLYMGCMPQIYSNVKEYSSKQEYKGKMYASIDLIKVYNKLLAPYEKVYSIYSKDSGDLHNDFFSYITTKVSDYWQKDFAMETLIIIAMENFGTINWGYIPETKNGKNSIKRNKEKILIGFDIEGFNMSVRVHGELENIKNVLINQYGSCEMPDYIGNEDMEVWDRNIGAAILMPLSPHHRKQVIAEVKNMDHNSESYNFGKHIECTQYNNNLNRIQKWKDPNGRKGIRTYTDLQTGDKVNNQTLEKN